MSRQSLFNAGFAPQAMTRPTAAGAAGRGVFAGQFGRAGLPGTRAQSGPQEPIAPESSVNLARNAQEIDDFLELADQYEQSVAPARLTRAQQLAVQQAAQSQSQFAGVTPQLINQWRAFVGRQTGGAGTSGMQIAGSRPGSRAGSRFQQQPAVDVSRLTGGAGAFLGQGEDIMDLATFGQQPQQAPLQPQQGLFGLQQGAFQQGAIPTRLEELQAQQGRLGAFTAPANIGGAGQGLGTANFAARYRHNSSDGAAGQAYAAGYGRNGRRNSVGFGRQDAALNPFATQSFAGQYGNAAQSRRSNFAGQYGNQNQFGNQGQFGAQAGRSNFAHQYGNQNQFGAQAGRSNFAHQYGNNASQVSRQRRASLGVGNGYF